MTCRSKGEFTKERIQAEAGRRPAGLMGGPPPWLHDQWAPRPRGSISPTPTQPSRDHREALCTHIYESVVNIGIGVGGILLVVPALGQYMVIESSLTVHHGTNQETYQVYT